jgi:mono/diheme cytochrome c family protein
MTQISLPHQQGIAEMGKAIRITIGTLGLGAALVVGGCDRAGTDGKAPPAKAADPVERGRYLTTIMDCGGCHDTGAFTDKRPEGGHLAGSDVGFELPGMGVFYPPNLTPHPDKGTGRWSEADIVKAIRTGVRPDGRTLAPIMPWMNYAALTDEDAAAIAAYLKSMPPSEHQSPGPASVETAKSPYLTVKMPQLPAASPATG